MSQTGLTLPRLSHTHLEPAGNKDWEMRGVNEGVLQARATSDMRISRAGRGGYVLKGQRYPSLRVGTRMLWRGTLWGWDTSMLLHWT